MSIRIQLIILLFLTSLHSCNQGEIELGGYEPKIVVEGRIENGRYASVQLFRSAPLSGINEDSINLINNIIHAIVVVSDGVVQDTLYERLNMNLFPPIEYVGRKLIGEVGKTYTLKVIYGGSEITGTTHIPAPVMLDDIWYKKVKDSDTVGYIYVRFKNESDEYYQAFTKPRDENGVYVPCLFGGLSSGMYEKGKDIEVQLSRGLTIFPSIEYDIYYSENKPISIKFCTQPREGYDFWLSFQNELLNLQNPVAPANKNLKSNINGGIGIWCGYGISEYHVNLKEIQRK